MPSLLGEAGGEFPVPSFTGCALGGLPLGHVEGALGVWLPPSLSCPICTALGGVLPTSGSIKSDSLETMQGTGQSGYSVLDLWQCLPGSRGPPPTLCQWKEDDNKMSRVRNPLRECLCHMCSEGLCSILHQSPVALLIIKEEICHAWAVQLCVLKIPQYRISLQDM